MQIEVNVVEMSPNMIQCESTMSPNTYYNHIAQKRVELMSFGKFMFCSFSLLFLLLSGLKMSERLRFADIAQR